MICFYSYSLSLVKPEEWMELKTFVSVDREIVLSRVEEEAGQVTFLVSPGHSHVSSINPYSLFHFQL